MPEGSERHYKSYYAYKGYHKGSFRIAIGVAIMVVTVRIPILFLRAAINKISASLKRNHRGFHMVVSPFCRFGFQSLLRNKQGSTRVLCGSWRGS